MLHVSTAEPEPGAALLNHLIDASQARCDDHVSVAGADSLAVCLALYRRGYDHATCRARASAPHTPDQATDVLWLLDVPDEASLSVTLAHLGRDLRCGGRLVIRLSQDTPPERIRRMRLCLMSHGFLPTAAAEDWPGGDRLLCARKANKPRACAA